MTTKTPKPTENKAKDVETKKPVFYRLPEPLRQAVLNYIANSIPRSVTVQDAVNLATALQRLDKETI